MSWKRVSEPISGSPSQENSAGLGSRFCGTACCNPVSGEVKAFLSNRNALPYLKETPQSIDEKELKRYDVIVVMEQVQANAVLGACPECKVRIIAWNIEDPYFLARDDAENIFLQIENKVKELAKSV